MKSTIALFGSSRRNGNTGQLMDRLARELQIEVIDLAACNISTFDYQHRNRDDAFEALIEHVLTFEQIIFASPVYWYAASAPMKVFLDRLCDLLEIPELLDKGRQLRGKTGHVLCTSVYAEVAPAFLSAFNETFRYLDMAVGQCLHVNCQDGYLEEANESPIAEFVRLVRGASLASGKMS